MAAATLSYHVPVYSSSQASSTLTVIERPTEKSVPENDVMRFRCIGMSVILISEIVEASEALAVRVMSVCHAVD